MWLQLGSWGVRLYLWPYSTFPCFYQHLSPAVVLPYSKSSTRVWNACQKCKENCYPSINSTHHSRMFDERIESQKIWYCLSSFVQPVWSWSEFYFLHAGSISKSKCHAYLSLIPVFTARCAGSVQIWMDDWASSSSHDHDIFKIVEGFSIMAEDRHLWKASAFSFCEAAELLLTITLSGGQCLHFPVSMSFPQLIVVFISVLIAHVQKLVVLCKMLITS